MNLGRIQRLHANWVYATPFVALLLVGLYPVMGSNGIALSLFLALPAYMLHQYEEHDDNRFAQFVSTLLPSYKRGLPASGIWVINVIFVWFFLLGVFYLELWQSGWAVLAAYLLLVNGVSHIGMFLARSQYNPGLITAVTLFLPLGYWILTGASSTTEQHLISLLVVIALHIGIALYALAPNRS